MNDNFSFDGADAADMPLDLSFSSLPLPEGEAAAGFHLPEMTPAQEQAKADSPKLVDEWRQDVQMLDDGGLNGLEERAGLEAGVSLDAEAAEEEGSESFNPQLGDMDSVRRKGSMLMKGVEERKREQARDRQNMVMNLLRAGRNDQEALKRIAERWGEDAVSRLESANEEDRSYMLGMWLEEVLGDGDRDVGFQIYKNTHDLWGKGIVSPEQVWKDFAERGKDIVEREDRQRVERERRISDLNGVVSRYVSGEQDSLSADERMALFHAGVSVASMEKARRGVRLMEAFEQDSRLYHDDIADDLFGIIGNDDDALTMLCNLLRNRSRSTAHDRLGMGGAEKRADEAYQEVMENSNPLVMAVAGQSILNAKMTAGGLMTGKVAGVKTKRSLERALQNMRSHEDARMKAAALQVSVAKARQMGLSDAEAFELAGVQEQERRELQQKRSRIFSALTTALEGGEDDYFSSDEASSLSKVGYHLGSMTGDTAPWFLPYAGPLIGLNTSMQRRREEGYMLGLDVDEIEKRAFWFGAADAAEEMIGFHGLFRATPLYKGVRKLLRTKKGAGVRAQVSGSPAAQYALQGVAGTVEEGILEPTAGYLMRSAINPLLDDERGKQTWDQYASELSQMTSGEQGLALLAFSFGLSGLNYSQLSRAAREFRLSLKNYEALGGTAQGYLEAREEKTAEGFLNKALANLHDSWMEDPQSSMERASAAAGERLSGERIESLRELDAWRAAEDAGMVPRVEPAEQEGMFRVYAPARSTKAKREDSTATTGQQEESNQPSYTLMDGEQMTAYLQAFVSEQMESDILYTQHLLAGDVTVNQALAQGRFDAAEVITRTVTDEKTGAERVVIAPETLGQMKARADMAMAAIRALEAEGVSYEDAAARMDASLSEHLPLGTLVKTWEEAQERIRTEQARNPEFKVPAMDAPFSNAYVTKVRRGDTFRRVLRYARGNATVEDLMEETMEQAVISWQAEQGLTWGEFGAMLQEAQRAMNELFPEARGEEMQFIHLDAGKPVTEHDAIEAFSKIGRSRWLADAVNHPSLPSWLRKLLNHLVKFLGAFKARVQLGEMVRQAEEQGVFTLPVRQALAVMLDAGNALYRDQQGDLMELSMERARAQAELDAMFGAGVATEARTLEDELAESRKEDEERRKEAEDEARAPENSPEAQEARREREQARVEALGEPDGSGVFNGAFIEVQEGVRLGFIDKNKLTLCPDVPQFKQGADEQTGVVNPIVGAWQRNAAPISVWRREDGSLQVISGRHRFNACTDEDINCTVYDEAAGFDLDWAQTHDVENNIRDGQASLFEIARYVSQKGLTKEEAVERGIFRKGQSRRGVELGMYGCSDLLDALGNELVSPDDAWRVAMAFRNQTEVQRAGLRALMEGKSWQQAFAVMQVAANMDRIRGLAEAAGMTFETDLFGNSHAEEYFARLAQYAAARVSELTKEISSISGASRRPETAKKYGVDVKDAAALEAVVKDLKAQRARWQNFGLHEDLIKEANDAVMVELGVKTREEVDRENGVLPLEAPEQEAVSADTGMLQLSQDVSRMLDAALARGAAPAEDEAPAANFSLVSIPSGDVITTAAEMRARLKPLQGKVFVNKNTGIQAVIEARVSGKTVGKAGAAQMSVANLKALGFSAEEARRVHYTATARIHELFENAEDGFFEEAYKQDASKAGAYHFFNTVDIEGIGAFDVNVTAIKYVKEQEGNVLYTLELTIENPATRGAASREGRLPTPFKDGVSTRNLSSYRSFVEKEKAAVRKKAVADGTFMKAPNGANTNLTEDQWLSVRTAAFKNWFGDWEKDPQNASKVVDENGEPRVVYHGTYGDFTVFDKAKIGSATDYGIWGRGFYFTNMENTPYGNKKLALFLNIRNPFIFNDYKSAEEIGDYLNIWDGNFHEDDRFGIFRPYATGAAQIADSAQERGHDGLIAVLGKWTEYIAFEPNQIKSATDNRGTFDPKNPDITFSVIGPNAATWGKYADKAFAGRDDGKLRAEIDASQASLKAPENFPFLSMFDEWSRGMGYRKNPVWRGLLEDVLNFDELYEAYPSLRKMYVFAYKNKKDSARGYYDSEERSITINLAHIGPIGAQLSTLLHEIQHAIQDIEGFARGSNLEEGRSLDDYMRSAGEIESRNVEKRILWDGERRESKPFNDTLEFPGEAIVSFSIASAQEQGLFHDGHFEAGNAVITKPGVTFSIIGEKAESFQEYHNNGLSYTDPADGKRKAIIDSRGVRLRKEHVSVSEGGHVNVSLAAALDFPELFRAYPELRKLRVDFYRDSRSGTGGFTDPQEHYIAVNVARGGKNAAPGMVLDTILHEVQHVIQGYEGFARGAGSMSREQALAYLRESMSQLAGRDDAWAKEALPRLDRMRQELEAGTLQPAFVYVFSHGEQEARLAGSFEKNSEGVLMSGLNGFRLLDAPPFSIPLTGDITELGGITFGGGRFGRMAGRVLAPNGDWLYDEMVFRMRAAAQRSVSKLRLYETGDRERGLELLAEAQELISTVERYLPGSYGFGLEPYKIWLNVFSLLYGNSGKMAPGDAVASALEAIPMKRWPEIMEGSIGKSFVNWAEKRPELEDVVEEARREIAERQADYELDSAPDADNRAALAARKGVEQEVWRRLFEEHGAEFLEEYGEQKVYRLISKFMARVVEQIDRFRKDRTLGRIRRVAASVAPRTSPQGKPLRGKMDAESYRRLEDRLRLMEMTPAQYDAFFRKNFPEVLDEEAAGQQEGRTLWEDVKPQDPVTVETTDAEGGALALTVTKATFEAYACYEKMSVETAENAARALGEFISTKREAWENAAESKKNEIEDLLRPVLEAAGRTDDQAMATHRKQARLKTLPSGPMSLTGYLLNFSQYMQGLQSIPAFRGIAKKFERRAARFAVQKQACEKDTLAFVKKAAGRILQTADEYEIADWIYEQRGGLDTGLTITEQEPDWQGKAREEYRAGVLNLIRRKVRKRGAARTLAHVAFLMKDMDAELKEEIRRVWPDARDEVWSEKDAAVFTEKELDRYGSQEKYVEEHAARARKASKWGKGKSPYQAQSYKLDHISRMEAAYIILLSQQEDYQEMLRLKGFTQDVLEALEVFAGKDVMEFSRALREKLNERGQEVKEVTESRYGAPFPMIENYFRAFFDVGIEAIDQSIMDAASYGDAATGGKFGLIHARKKHHASLDLSIDVLTAYYAAMNEQDVYLYGSEISRDMRALINYRGENGTRGARVLEKVIGRDALNKLLVWCDSFDKGMAGNVRGFLEMQKSLNRISSAAAITLLPGRVGTWLKQSTALINAAFSSDEIDPHEWAASMARMAAGKLALSPRELMKRAALDARDATETAVIREAMSADEAGRAASGAWKRLNVKGMNMLTRTDAGLNAVSSAILYDAVYRKEMKRNPGLSREEADRRAMMEVELSLSRKAQPMTPQQRSLAAQTRSVWNVGMLFLGGESINTFAETVALWKQGGMKNKAKSVSMFYAHGLLLAAMSAMLNFFTDDERRRKRREWWHIFIDAIQGPLQGIPFWGALAGGAVRGMSSLCGCRYYEATTSLVPFASWDNLERAGKDLAKLFDGKDKDWVDFPLAFMGALRMAAFGAALGGASTPKGARFKAAAFSAAAFVNLTEFLLRAMKGLPLRLEGK
nr:MAG TPA: PolyVal ADP-Ribosyltransferase [Caudoviricetes sp.]